MITQTYQIVRTSSQTRAIQGAVKENGNSETPIDVDLVAGATNQAQALAFVTANLRGIMLISTADMTIKVNSTSSPILTINLKANSPYFWSYSQGYFANPFTADSVTWYLTTVAANRLTGSYLLA